MNKNGLVRTTLVGGLLFLLPIAVLSLILGKVFQWFRAIAEPMEKYVPIESLAGFLMVDLLAVLAILLVCFVAGLAARRERLKGLSNNVESMLVASIPGYTFAKSMVGGIVKADDEIGKMKAVLVRMDDFYQLAFEVERTPRGYVSIYLPGAPNPLSGTVAYFESERVEVLDLQPHEAMKIIRVLGRNGSQLLVKDGEAAV